MRWMLAFIILAASTMLTPFGELKCQAEITPTVDPKNSRVVTLKDFPDTNPKYNPTRTHDIRIYLPADYGTSTKKYPVIYFHDGEQVFAAGFSDKLKLDGQYPDVVYDRLIAQDLINPAILVAVAPSYGNRNEELTPPITRSTTRPAARRNSANPATPPTTIITTVTTITPTNITTTTTTTAPPGNRPERDNRFGKGGGLEDYYDFLAHQVKPYIDSHYRTLTDPAHTGVAGSSFGGLASVYLGYHHPETFGLAGCMSPSLWYDSELLADQIQNDLAPKIPTRFWFVVGAKEGENMWKPTMRTAAALKKRGWVEGKDVALYLDYTGIHANPTWAAQAPAMLQFLLGKQNPTLNNIAIKQLNDPSGKPISLFEVREVPFAALELQYNGGYRLNAIDPQFTSDRPDIFTVNNDVYHTLVNKNRGLGLLQASYDGFTAQQVVAGYIPPTTETFTCPIVKTALDVHMPLSAWPELTYPLDFSFAHAEHDPSFPPPTPPAPPSATKAASDQSGKFGVWYDDKYLYVALAVNKKPLVLDATLPPWGQDAVELRLDARPDPVRTWGRGEGEMQQILLLAVSPDPQSPTKPTVYQPEGLPQGTLYTCHTTEEGFSLQAAIPVSYLNTQQMATWKSFRLNLVVDTKEAANGPTEKHWWQPDWRSEANVPGSGTFVRVEPTTAPAAKE